MLGIHAWIFDQFILSCGRYCLLDITYKVFAKFAKFAKFAEFFKYCIYFQNIKSSNCL